MKAAALLVACATLFALPARADCPASLAEANAYVRTLEKIGASPAGDALQIDSYLGTGSQLGGQSIGAEVAVDGNDVFDIDFFLPGDAKDYSAAFAAIYHVTCITEDTCKWPAPGPMYKEPVPGTLTQVSLNDSVNDEFAHFRCQYQHN